MYGKSGTSGQAQLHTKRSWTLQILSPFLDHLGEHLAFSKSSSEFKIQNWYFQFTIEERSA